MTTAFDLTGNEWAVAWPGRVSRHDLVYLSPPLDPLQGLPLGNGDLGALLWCEADRLVLQLNKSDLWEDANFGGRFRCGAHHAEEDCTGLRHAGRLVLDFKQPLFDPFYLREFEARLSLADATLHLHASGPLGEVTLRAFISLAPAALWLEAVTEYADASPQHIHLERFGSRAFSRWYAIVHRDPAIGLAGTQAHVAPEQAWISQTLSSGQFAVGFTLCQQPPGKRAEYRRAHRHAVEAHLAADTRHAFTMVATCTSLQEADPGPGLNHSLQEAKRTSISTAQAAHAAEWKAFWLRSFMDCGDDYLNNLWHLTMYYLNASQRGAWPGRFINGLWGWNRDVQPWLAYFHWNQQALYWPLHAAGHHDLLEPYLQLRFRGLDHARADARDLFHADGAFVSDVSDRRGVNSESEKDNHTPVAEIALDFWRHYRYTGNREFLRTRALPYLIEAALFFESRFTPGEDGLFHAKEGSACEGQVIFRDVASELVAGLTLFPAVLAALAEAGETHPRAIQWRELATRLAPLPMAEAAPDLIDQRGGHWALKHGWFKGNRLASNQLLAVGYRVDQGKVMIGAAPNRDQPEAMPDMHDLFPRLETTGLQQNTPMRYVDVFPEVEYLSVFPSGLISLATCDTAHFHAAVNTLKLYAPGVAGYDRLPVAMARVGLGREAWRVIADMPRRWQFYVNGFGHYHWGMKADQALRFYQVTPVDAANVTTPQTMLAAPFRHMGMESMSVLCCAMNECLLQSQNGVIRVAAAAAPDRDARFTLHAEGGFVVSSEVHRGRVRWVVVESRWGGRCRLARPWRRCHGFRAPAVPGTFVPEPAPAAMENVLECELAAGERWLVTPSAALPVQWMCVPETPDANLGPKQATDSPIRLGLPRLF